MMDEEKTSETATTSAWVEFHVVGLLQEVTNYVKPDDITAELLQESFRKKARPFERGIDLVVAIVDWERVVDQVKLY